MEYVLNTLEKSISGAINEIKDSVDSISDPYEINLTNLLAAEDSESISTAIGGIDNLNATVQDNRIIVGTISNGNVSVSIRILGNVTTLYYLLDSVLGLTLNEVAITNTSGTLSKSVTTHSVLTENMVINSLNSDETTLPLSAAQGKVLNEKILNSDKVYVIDGSLLNEDNPTSEQISEAIGGWDNLANAVLNNNIILLQVAQSGFSQYCVAILALTGETDEGIQLWFMVANELMQLVFTKQADTVSLGKSSSTLATSQDITDAINALDSSGQTTSTGEVISSVSQENGVVQVQKKTLSSDDIPELPQSKITDLDTALAAKADASALAAHTSNTSNPHSVTKEQVGLGNVDNTSDADKPISTATQDALDGKQATLVSGTNIKTLNGESLLGSGNITTYTPSSIDVTTLFADTASIASGISAQIAALGNSGVTEFPVLYAGSAIGNIKPTWIRTTSGVTNMMCIADNKIWYFEIQGTTVQRASLAIS